MKVCFFASAKNFEVVEFYQNDIRILKDLEFEVVIANKVTQIPSDCDIYFIWRWSSGVKALFKALLLKKPSIMVGNIHYRDTSPAGYLNQPLLSRLAIRLSLRFADAVLATANVELEDIKLLGAKRPFLVYNCVDTSKYRYSGQSRENLILTISHLDYSNGIRKRIRELIQAVPLILNKHPDHRFVIAGTKLDMYPLLVEKVKSLSIEDYVTFPGRISDEQKIDYYHRAKIYLQPTVYEGFGVALAESMSCGTPVVTNRVGATPEVVGDCAVFINGLSPCAIALAVNRLIEDDQLWQKLSFSGRQRVEALFSYEIRRDAIQEVILSLAGR